MFCSECGANITVNSGSCPNCGFPLGMPNSSMMNGVGKVIISRGNRFVGALISFDVKVDGQNIGSLGNGSTLEWNLPFGTHQVTISSFEKSVDAQVVLSPNKTQVVVNVELHMGLLTGVPKIKEVL